MRGIASPSKWGKETRARRGEVIPPLAYFFCVLVAQ